MIEGLDPESGIESEYRRCTTDSTYAWRAQRLLSRSGLLAFTRLKGDPEALVLHTFPDIRSKFGISEDPLDVVDRAESKSRTQKEAQKATAAAAAAKGPGSTAGAKGVAAAAAADGAAASAEPPAVPVSTLNAFAAIYTPGTASAPGGAPVVPSLLLEFAPSATAAGGGSSRAASVPVGGVPEQPGAGGQGNREGSAFGSVISTAGASVGGTERGQTPASGEDVELAEGEMAEGDDDGGAGQLEEGEAPVAGGVEEEEEGAAPMDE